MRGVLQRVLNGSVTVENKVVGEINRGIVALVGFIESDDDKVIDYMLDKIINLRIFEDENGKLNLSLLDVKGDLLIIPNFTLYGDARKGRRPGYSNGASVEVAKPIFDRLIEKALSLNIKVEKGVFQADMKVGLINDGPVTILLDSEKLF